MTLLKGGKRQKGGSFQTVSAVHKESLNRLLTNLKATQVWAPSSDNFFKHHFSHISSVVLFQMKSRNLVIWITILFYINWDVMVFLKVFASVVKLRDPRQNRDYRTVDCSPVDGNGWRPRNPQRLSVTSYLWWMATTVHFVEPISNSKRKIHWRQESMWNGYFNFIGSRNRKLSFWTY